MVAQQHSQEELDPEEKLQLEAAAEIASHFRRLISGARTFPAGHKTLIGYFEGILDKFRAYLAKEDSDGELSLGVTPLGFKLHGELLNPAESLADSFTHPLYLDGVHQLVISQGVTMADLTSLMEIWRATLDNKLGDTHTFCTRFWEADLATVHIVAVESFAETGVPGEQRPKSEIQVVVDELSGLGGSTEAAAGARGVVTGGGGRRIAHVSRADLELLRLHGVPDLTEEELARTDTAERARISGLTAQEAAALGTEVASLTAKQLERTIDALFLCGLRASRTELETVSRAFVLVIGAMVNAGMFERLKINLNRVMAAARSGDPSKLEARFQLLARLVACLGAQQVLGKIVDALDDEEKAPLALALLRFLPPTAVGSLLDWLPVPETEAGRRLLADVAATAVPKVAELVPRLAWSDEAVALELMRIGAATPPAEGWALRKAALAHVSLRVQKAALVGVPKEVLLAHKAELLPLLASPVPELRYALFTPFVASKDPGVPNALGALLKKVPIDDPERKRVIIALGQLGGPDAGTALRAEYGTLRDADLKVVCAHAMGNSGDEKCRPLLQADAGKLFGGGALKKAAQEALARLDLMKGKK